MLKFIKPISVVLIGLILWFLPTPSGYEIAYPESSLQGWHLFVISFTTIISIIIGAAPIFLASIIALVIGGAPTTLICCDTLYLKFVLE